MAEKETKGTKDDPRQANEEGDPKETGRSRGHVVDENDPMGPTRTDPDEPGADKDNSQHWESGRQRAN